MSTENHNDLDALRELEGENSRQFQSEGTQNLETIKPNPNLAQSAEADVNRPNAVDGFIEIPREALPNQGDLYPDSWRFAYRCPTSKEVANFSTITDQDQVGLFNVTEDLIRKCVIIYDEVTQKRVSTGEICDGHRVFFLLLLRSYYLPGKEITYNALCADCQQQSEVTLTAGSLIYPELKEKLLAAYDGRTFTLDMGLDKPIIFRIPTLETAGRIWKYITKIYRNTQQGGNEKKNDNIVFDKQFLLMAPFLYETGKETVRDLTLKYKTIQRDNKRFGAYLEIINRLKLDNEEYFEFECPHCESLEETQIKFPGGWKKLFVSTKDTTGYFD